MEGQGANNKAEIDTNAPFRSVKEAVSLFGDKILAGQFFANKINEIHGESSEKKNVASELDETKKNIQKNKGDSKKMADFLSPLQRELVERKQALRHLNQQESKESKVDFEISKDNKIVEEAEFEKKRNVSFANPPSLTQVIVVPQPQGVEKLEKHHSFRNKKKKKKPLIPLIGGIFSKKKS